MLKRMSCMFDVFFIDICIDFGIERFLNREAMENFNGENEQERNLILSKTASLFPTCINKDD